MVKDEDNKRYNELFCQVRSRPDIRDAAFHGGCNGNLNGIVALCKGQKIADVKERLAGITCGGKNTSCPDQFAQLLKLVSE